jgi:hypothetical protein
MSALQNSHQDILEVAAGFGLNVRNQTLVEPWDGAELHKLECWIWRLCFTRACELEPAFGSFLLDR